MSDLQIRVLLYVAITAHIIAGAISWRRGNVLPLVPLINFATAFCVVAYALKRLYGVIVNDITWYGTDTLFPLYALAVCIFSLLALSGKTSAPFAHWLIFVVQLLALIAALLFFTFFKMSRMI